MKIPKKKEKQRSVKKNRKQLRKEKRKEKKARKNDYYMNRNKAGKFVLKPPSDESDNEDDKKPAKKVQKNIVEKSVKFDQSDKDVAKEKREQQKLAVQMQKQRKKQLKIANDEEDKNIKMLEKQLKLNRRKTKGIPKSFVSDGLDYLLEVCDREHMDNIAAAERQLKDGDDDFDEDFALMTGNNKKSSETESEDSDNSDTTTDNKKKGKDKKIVTKKRKKAIQEDETDEDEESYDNKGFDDVEESDNKEDMDLVDDDIDGEDMESDDGSEEDGEMGSEGESDEDKPIELHKNIKNVQINKKNKETKVQDKKLKKQKVNNGTIKKNNSDDEMSEDKFGSDDNSNEENEDDSFEADEEDEKNRNKKSKDGIWEDIYGRMRDKDGNIVNDTTQLQKYIPPAVRAKMEAGLSEDKKRTEKFNRLKRQLKGLLNRLAESNMYSISNQIEDLYMQNSRHEMNEALTTLIFESLVTNINSPERLLQENVLLITILHSNVGTEVGAHFLQTVIKKFDDLTKTEQPIENKCLDNIVNIISQLYNFKVFHSQLLYQIVQRLYEDFNEKSVECILSILKNVGFTMRKDDPLALKDLILNLQKKATTASADVKDNPRVKFMLEILLAIKNNNMNKIPNYDTSYSEHLKKIMRGFIRKGNYVTQMNISLDDLLKAEERGKWWVVGSAWTGKIGDKEEKSDEGKGKKQGYSQKLLDLAKKQRMNTDARRNIFCIIMSAEDYMDAFEKLMHMNLKNQQEREIIHVLLHCCLQEKTYNPYYSVLAQKFCDFDRKYQMIIKYSIWDKLKALTDCSGEQISNLAKLLTHLFLEKGLPISVLKVVQFGDLDKITLRFVRQILLGVLLNENVEQCQEVFERVAHSEKLKMFRERLRLFIHHFLLRNVKDEKQKLLLEERTKIAEKILTLSDKKTKF